MVRHDMWHVMGLVKGQYFLVWCGRESLDEQHIFLFKHFGAYIITLIRGTPFNKFIWNSNFSIKEFVVGGYSVGTCEEGWLIQAGARGIQFSAVGKGGQVNKCET